MTYDDNDDALSMAVTTALLESQTPIAPAPERAARMRTKLLAAIHAPDAGDAKNGLHTLRACDGEWITTAPGIAVKLLRSGTKSRSYLMRMQPGASVPPHQHVDVDEECFVLEGEARVGDLQLFAGDYHLAPRGVPHDWLVSNSGALLLLRSDLQPQFLTTP